jgi:hypothetical protein
MTNESNPPRSGSAILESLLWREPAARPAPTEAQRVAEEARLRSLADLGAAIGTGFDVAEAMHAKGMRTSEEIEAERVAAEAKKARDEAMAKQSQDFDAEMAGREGERDGAAMAERIAERARKAIKQGVKEVKRELRGR